MIYVEEKDFSRQIQLFSFLASGEDILICAWLYPESTSRSLAGFEITDNPESLIPITTYENGFQPKCTSLVLANDTSIKAFSSAYSELKKNCDSLALYKKSEPSWTAATIGHEGMCLVQDTEILNSLIQAGYSASSEAPAWW
jgi:hypothetical protein